MTNKHSKSKDDSWHIIDIHIIDTDRLCIDKSIDIYIQIFISSYFSRYPDRLYIDIQISIQIQISIPGGSLLHLLWGEAFVRLLSFGHRLGHCGSTWAGGWALEKRCRKHGRFIWICIDWYGSIWIYLDLYGFIWIYKDLQAISRALWRCNLTLE